MQKLARKNKLAWNITPEVWQVIKEATESQWHTNTCLNIITREVADLLATRLPTVLTAIQQELPPQALSIGVIPWIARNLDNGDVCGAVIAYKAVIQVGNGR